MRAKDLATNKEIKKLIENFEKIFASNLQKLFFNAVMNNNIEEMQKLVINKLILISLILMFIFIY